MADKVTHEMIEILTTGDEKALREFQTPYPETVEDVNAIITALADRKHDYGTCVYAMSIAAEAAFNHIASKLGCTGFQASMADLDIVRRTRSLKGPFALIDGNEMLYPQYDIETKVRGLLTKWEPWASDEAKKLLADKSEMCHPNVKTHWEELASRPVAEKES